MRKNHSYYSEPGVSHSLVVKVRFNELDPMMIVWHGNYARYFEDGREAFGREFAGIGYEDIMRQGYKAPIVDMRIEYLHPLKINDEMEVVTRMVNLPGAQMVFEYLIKERGTDRVMARGYTKQVFLDADDQLCLVEPDFFKEWRGKWMD